MANFKPKYCKICGKEFIPVARNNTICPNEKCKEIGITINHKNYERRTKERAIRERNNEFLKKDNLSELSRKAREDGMSYGKYVLMLQQKVM